MRLLSRLEYERSFGGRWGIYFVRIPKKAPSSDSFMDWKILFLENYTHYYRFSDKQSYKKMVPTAHLTSFVCIGCAVRTISDLISELCTDGQLHPYVLN
jgi:hypothetical protein